MDETNHVCVVHEGLVAGSPQIGGGIASLPDLIPASLIGNGGWKQHLPAFETQRKVFPNEPTNVVVMHDSMNCVQCSRAMLSATLANLAGKPVDISERAWYWLTGCTANGNSYGACDAGVRRGGGCAETRWPWDRAMTRAEYGQQPPGDVVAEMKTLLDTWEFGQLVHVPNTVDDLKAALVKGPIWFCNDIHSMMLYDVDDRLRVWDTEANATNGFGSFPLDYIPQIVAAYLAPFTLKNPTPTPMPTAPSVVLPDNCLVTVVFADRQEQWLHLGGKMISNPADAMYPLKQWIARNENPVTHTFDGGPTRTISEKDFDTFPHVDSKGNPL